MTIKACFLTHTGRTRNHNEDSILIDDLLVSDASMAEPTSREYEKEKALFMVADGMGGHAKGETASMTVLDEFRGRREDMAGGDDILGIARDAKDRLDEMARADKTAAGLGTTVAGILLQGEGAVIFNCGDSRVYRLDGPRLQRLSQDHSLVQELVDRGVLSERDARVHPQKNIITSAITGGLEEGAPRVALRDLEIRGRQTFLLCTDGLWESMDTADMAGCFAGGHPQDIVRCLFMRAMDTAARDNISIIVVEVTPSPRVRSGQ